MPLSTDWSYSLSVTMQDATAWADVAVDATSAAVEQR
jgi:hypothetical protein